MKRNIDYLAVFVAFGLFVLGVPQFVNAEGFAVMRVCNKGKIPVEVITATKNKGLQDFTLSNAWYAAVRDCTVNSAIDRYWSTTRYGRCGSNFEVRATIRRRNWSRV